MDSSGPQNDQTELERERVPLERKISLKFKEFRGFITEYSANISMGGMFITTDSPQPPGSVFDFEFRLADDDFQIIHGLGEVVWIRQDAAGPERPAGMGIRFLHLGEGSRDLIRRMVDEHVRSGGTPFDLEEHAPTTAKKPAPPTQPGPPAPSPEPSRSRISAEELGETRSLDLDPELEPTAPLRLDRDVERETVLPTIEEPPEPDAGGEDDESMQRFDAAMAALKQERAAARTEAGLPPGFDEVAAALRTEDGEVEPAAAEPPPPQTRPPRYAPYEPPPQPAAPSPEDRTQRLDLRDTDHLPPPPPEPQLPLDEAHYGAGRSGSDRFRWFLVALVVVVGGAAVAHFTMPGGLPGLLASLTGGDDQQVADGTPAEIPETASESATVPTAAEASSPAEEEEPATTAEPEISTPATGEPEDGPAAEPIPARAQPPAEPPAFDPEAPLPVSTAPFSRLRNVTWREEGGATVVILTLDGEITENRFSNFRLGGDSPREVVRLLGVAEPYIPTEIPVGTAAVVRIRVGYHPKPGGNELHLVMDLTGDSVELRELRPVGSRLEITLD